VRCRIAFGFAALLAAIAASAIACSNFVLYDLFSGKATVAPPAALALSPAAAEVYINSSLSLVATGGKPGYVYYFKSGAGSGTINAVTGLYTAPPGAATDTIEVTDAAGAKADATITVLISATLTISPAPTALIKGGSFQFGATGGFPPYKWSIKSGVGSIDSTGLYSAGSSTGTATVRVTDSTLAVSDSTSIAVNATGPLSISPGSPSVEEGGTVTFVALGGTTPYNSFSLGPSPSGSIVGSTGVYTAAMVVGTNMDTVRVTDSASPTPATATASITVLPARPANLVANGTAGGPHDIGLSWTNQASSLDGFRIERGTDGSNFTMVALVASGVTAYLDSGLALNTIYYYRVIAYKGTLNSPPSNAASALPN